MSKTLIRIAKTEPTAHRIAPPSSGGGSREILPPSRPCPEIAPPSADHFPPAVFPGPGAGYDLASVAIHPLPDGPLARPFVSAGHACPVQVQTKLVVGAPDDEYEREADRAAERVTAVGDMGIPAGRNPREEPETMDAGLPPTPSGITAPRIQLQTGPADQEMEDEEDEEETGADEVIRGKPAEDDWEEEEEDTEEDFLRPKLREPGKAAATPGLRRRIHSLRGGGRPLDAGARAYFEPRFGTDFGHVRVHQDAGAAGTARALNARAYTLGRDIVFGPGEYSPATPAGKRLLAHELAHVIQQADGRVRRLQRMAIGQGKPPAGWKFNIRAVPANERKRVLAAIRLVEEVTENPRRFRRCHDFFKRKCPRGTSGTLRTISRRARIWRITDNSSDARADVNGSIIAYTSGGYNSGERRLASTLIHELMHNCGITGRKHYLADVASVYCMGRRNILKLAAVGADLSTGDLQILFAYRRILYEIATGRLQITAGGDINAMGTAVAVNQAWHVTPRRAADIASVMAGIRGRAGGWGAERHGGITGSVETGFGAGYFRMRNPRPGEDPKRTHLAGSYVLQLGLGAEFYIPWGLSGGRVGAFSFQVLYRMVQPLNSKAKQIHGVLGNLSLHFW
jgi:hypothetical protein